MIRKLTLILFLVVFPFLLTNTGIAENTGITSLEQAIKAARSLNSLPTEVVKAETKPAAKEGTKKEEAGQSDKGQEQSKEEKKTVVPDYSQANTVALDVACAVIDIDFSQKKQQYLESRQEELKLKLEKAQTDLKMGKIDAKHLEELNKEVIKNDFDLNFYSMQVENNKRNFQRLTGVQISEAFDFYGAYLIADAGILSLPEWVSGDKKATELEKMLSDVLAAYGKLGDLITAYIDSAEKLAAQENDLKMGKSDKDKVEAAVRDKEKARIDALEGKAVYSKLLYELDKSLNGFVSKEIKKVEKPVFLVPEG